MSAVVIERTITCQSDVCSLWDAITDTDRLNRAMGMNRLALKPIADGSAARYLVATSLGGFSVEYEERPYEWVYPESFKILRKMRNGPVRSLEMAWRLATTPEGGTQVTMRLTLDPRLAILTPIVRLSAGGSMREMEAAIRRSDEELAKHGRLRSAKRSEVRRDALTRAAAELRGVAEADDKPLADRLAALIEAGDDADVARIRPFALADEWSVDRRALLALCLTAVRAGLLELRWEILCPSCRTATEVLPSLASLSDHGACQLCEIRFAVDLDEAVEATFAPSKAVREVDAGPYCIGGPARTPHVLAQTILPAGGEARLPAPAEEGSYRLFVRGGAAFPIDVRADAPAESRAPSADTGERLAVAPSGAVVIPNPAPEERHVKLERLVWADQGARARIVTTMAAFRRDFSSEILRPGTALKVSRVGLFFSDLTGSTELYAQAGDAAAFRMVQDHFDVVVGLIERHHGTLVKTIGDAVMAVFSDDVDGLVASVAILRAFEDFRRDHEVRQRTHIKLGVFGGPCYVVTANGILDYFGQTVNVAARLQGEAKSGELVVEETLADRAIAAGMLDPALVRERYDAKLKGVPRPVRVARIRVAP